MCIHGGLALISSEFLSEFLSAGDWRSVMRPLRGARFSTRATWSDSGGLPDKLPPRAAVAVCLDDVG